MPIVSSEVLTPRESILMEADKEEGRLTREHAVTMKKLDIEAAKLETKWNILFKIPLTVIKLPVYIVFSIAYIAAVIKGTEPTEEFWKFLK